MGVIFHLVENNNQCGYAPFLTVRYASLFIAGLSPVELYSFTFLTLAFKRSDDILCVNIERERERRNASA